MERYYSANEYYKKRFGRKMFRLAVDCGFTCPNRDGTKGIGGCSFCSGEGSGDFAARGADVAAALQCARERISEKTAHYPGCGYICYFQAFTNTYAPVARLRELFTAAMEVDFVSALIIATRPDCIDESVAALLAELNVIKPVYIELGLQTANEETARAFGRGYTNAEFTAAAALLSGYGIPVTVHLIIGLPCETEEDILSTVRFVSAHDILGVKLQLLHLLRGTRLAAQGCETLEKEEYFRLLGICVENLPRSVVIFRLTGDGDRKKLISPLWSADKHSVLNGINRYFLENGIYQGRALERAEYAPEPRQ